MNRRISRRLFLQVSGAVAGSLGLRGQMFASVADGERPLMEVGYDQVRVTSELHLAQLENTHGILMGLSNDSLMKPLRAMAGLDAPGDDLGGWYSYRANYDYRTDKVGFAPGCNYGQWVSALARNYGMTGDVASREKVLELNRMYAATIGKRYYEVNRFPAYCFDKLACGLMDSHRLVRDPQAFRLLDATTDAAVQVLPGHAVDHDVAWRPDKDISWNWDESYTMPENLYLVYGMGAGLRYREMAEQYLNDETEFDPLARGENPLAHKHAYSYVNSLCSAMQSYLVDGSAKHLEAARNGFEILEAQSFATGGWGPNETLQANGSSALFDSLTTTHRSFETPCGSYAHMKLTRYLLRVTREGRYGDSMERVMYNTVLGARPLKADGSTYYYSDYNFEGRRVYHDGNWACCAGTLPQVATDYGVNSYLWEPGAVWVNLYVPSALRWSESGNQIELEQRGSYPLSDAVEFRVKAARPETFALHLRIPAWAEGARVAVNGRAVPLEVTKGFAVVRRTWKSGDVVELELPSKLRLKAIDAAHPDVVVLMQGPLVLFAKTSAQPALTREMVMAARRSAGGEWTVETHGEPLRLVPFTEVGDSVYTTYLRLS
ncbi:MAG: beta-L-arabinofuranosidase domain-containing protein [Acidobacteriaceae bacterium]